MKIHHDLFNLTMITFAAILLNAYSYGESSDWTIFCIL